MTGSPAARSDVLIVGAGPSGMVTAALLSRSGVSVRLVERYSGRLAFPKAHLINPVTLDICAQAGFDVARIIAEAKAPERDAWVRFRTSLLGEEIGRLPFERQPAQWSAHPRINLPQPRFEAILEEQVRAVPGIDLVRGRWLGLRTDTGGVVSSVRLADGEEVELSSRFVLAADGANSAVRRRLEIPMERFGDVVDVASVHFAADLSGWLDDAPAALYFLVDPRVRGVFIAHDLGAELVYSFFPSNGVQPTLEESTTRLRAAIGRDDIPFEVLGVSWWQQVSEVASRFAEQPVFLIGDAAHKLPPSGGLGMNTAIQDGANLAWKIAAVLEGWATPALLDTYQCERRPVALANTLQSGANAQATESLSRVVGRAIATGRLHDLDDVELAYLLDTQWDHFNSPGLQLGFGYADGQAVAVAGRFEASGAVGRRLPHTLLPVGDGPPTPVIDLVAPAGFTLLVQGCADAWAVLTGGAAVPCTVVDISGRGADRGWLDLVGLRDTGAALVLRPDGHIAARCPAATPQAWEPVLGALLDYVRHGTGLR